MRIFLSCLLLWALVATVEAATLSAGSEHTCAVVDEGVRCWGANNYGQLGEPRVRSSPMALDVAGLEPGRSRRVTAVGTGSGHTCAVVDGEAMCWGSNRSGQLGNGEVDDYTLHPVPASVETLDDESGHEVTQISAGSFHTCAVADGGVLCWGWNGEGRLGLGAGSPEQVGVPAAPIGLAADAGLDVKFVAAGEDHSCAASASRVWCWGANDRGELGTGTTQPHPQPQEVFGVFGEILALAAGNYATCAATTAGAFCWGYGSIFGDGSVDQLQPTKLDGMPADVVSIDLGSNHVCVATAEGAVSCQGYNYDGELGNGASPGSDFEVASTVDGIEAIEVAAGPDHTCARDSTEGIWCWGRKGQGQLGNGQDRRQRQPGTAAIASGATDVSSGSSHSCAAVSNGAMCWGNNYRGQLGNNSHARAMGPVQVQNLDGPLSSLSAGAAFTCATGGGIIRCWGANVDRQSGQSSGSEFLVPQAVAGVPFALSVEAGSNHACATSSAGELACWGDNAEGQLTGMQAESASPVIALPGGATMESAGYNFTCAVRNGGAYCWGNNYTLQLGREGPDSELPMSVMALPEGSGVTAVAAGNGFACAMVGSGIECWGLHENGQGGWGALPKGGGHAPGTYFAQPRPVVGLPAGSAVTSLSAGQTHACVVADGAAWCWGGNYEGQLGDGTTEGRYTAVPVHGLSSGVTRISAGDQHTCAVVSGAVKCWGNLEEGRLGNFSSWFRTTPVAVVPATLFESGFE